MLIPKPRPERDGRSESETGREPGWWLDRIESALALFGPLAIGIAAACYGVIGKETTAGGALVTGWAIWQVSMIVVVLWKVATANDDADDVERMRLGYKPRHRPRARR